MTQAVPKQATKSRRKPPADAQMLPRTAATQEEAVEIARQMLRSGEMIHVLVSKDTDVFTVRATDDLASFALAQEPSVSRTPNAKLATAIEASRQVRPRFATAEELFDALEENGQD